MRYSRLFAISFGVLAVVLPSAAEHIGIYQHGTIVKMRMGECLPDHSFVGALSGNSRAQAAEVCPEYTLLGDKVVYVIVGRPSKDVLPLAQELDFRLRKSEIAVRVDDERRETRFEVREMILRGEWDRISTRDEVRQRHFDMPVVRDQ